MLCRLLCRIKGSVLATVNVDEFNHNMLAGKVENKSSILHEGKDVWCMLDSTEDKYSGIIKELKEDFIKVFTESTGDKRMYLRAKVNAVMPVMITKAEQVKRIDVLVDNISFGGIGFYSYDEHPAGSEIVLKLALVKEYSFDGTVLYVRKDGDRYYHGVQFKPFKAANKEDALFTFIDEKLA